jgi:hypothetical protein
MKKIFTPLLIFISIQFSIANDFMCASSGLTFLPEKKEISLNSMFIIEGYAYSQKTINSFKNRNVFLESSNGEIVELILQQILKGQMSLTQAIFKTKKELKPNTKYFLKFSNLTKNEKSEMYQWNAKTKKSEQVYWQTTEQKKINLLNNNLKIDFKKTEVIHYGCGPSANAIFEILNKSENEIWYRTEIVDMTTGSKIIYIIREWNNSLSVGHGMCSGAFLFKEKESIKSDLHL